MIKTNLEKGIDGDEADLVKRRDVFGSNTYPQKKGRSFLVYYLLLRFTVLLVAIMLQKVHFIPVLCPAEVPLGSMARFNSDNLDNSCSSVIGTWNKNRGRLGPSNYLPSPFEIS